MRRWEQSETCNRDQIKEPFVKSLIGIAQGLIGRSSTELERDKENGIINFISGAWQTLHFANVEKCRQ